MTAKGVKPICPYQHNFENTYLFGAFSPITGSSLILDLPYCDAACFQIFLNHFSGLNKKEYKILILDNGAFHKAKSLKIPENICLVFLPAYSPELNPAEKVWWVLKQELKCKTFENIKHLKKELYKIVRKNITDEKIQQLCSYDYLLTFLDQYI